MICIKDTTGTLHDKCPRCGENWEWIKEPTHINCPKCSMMACLNSEIENDYFLALDIPVTENKTYAIYWHNSGCMIVVERSDEAWDDDGSLKDIQLPFLPFDITLEKLQTYLVFS